VTSFAPHYGLKPDRSHKCSYLMVLPRYPEDQLPPALRNVVYETVDRYERIPNEI
jgi:hypothetical protein